MRKPKKKILDYASGVAEKIERRERKQREGRTNYAKWLGDYYALRNDELELSIAWIAMRGESLAALPFGRKIEVQDLNSLCESVKAASK